MTETDPKHGRRGFFTRVRSPLVHYILLITACVVAYGNSMPVPFTFDDYPYLVENPLVGDFGYLFDHARIDGLYLKADIKHNFILRPVAYFTFTLNKLLTGLDPGGFRVVNIFIHASNALLVYLVVRLLLLRSAERHACSIDTTVPFVSFFSAMLFAVHPLQTQAVTYVVQRFTSLATFWYLLTVALYLSCRSGTNRTLRVASYLCALLAAICAMKTKEIAFTLPIVLVMIELFFFTGALPRRLWGLLPFGLTMAIVPATVLELAGRSSVTGGISLLEKGTNLVNFSKVPAHDYFITQFRVVVTYLRLLFLPVQQNLDYDYPLRHSLLDGRIMLSVALLLAVGGTGAWCYRQCLRARGASGVRLRLVAFGIFWFFVTLSVESSIIPIDDLIYEHRVYLPSVGMILASVCGLDLLRESGAGRSAVLGTLPVLASALIVAVLLAATVARNDVWKDIWADAAKKSPRKARPFNNQGYHLMKRGRPGEAIPWFRQAIERNPDNIEAHLNLGTAYSDTGSYYEALKELSLVVEKNPGDDMAWNNLGTVFALQGDLERAVAMYRKSLSINPGYTAARQNLAHALEDQGLGR